VGTHINPIPHETNTDDLETRVTALEVQINQLRQEVHTARLVITDDQGLERLVAERCNGAMELWIELPSGTAGHRTGVLLFGIAGQEDLCAGIGVQLWAHGSVVRELTWWADESAPSNGRLAGGSASS